GSDGGRDRRRPRRAGPAGPAGELAALPAGQGPHELPRPAPRGRRTMTTLAYRLMLLTVFTMPWEDVLSFPGAGSVSRLAGLSAGLVWVVSVVSSGRVREPRTPHLLAILFVL